MGKRAVISELRCLRKPDLSNKEFNSSRLSAIVVSFVLLLMLEIGTDDNTYCCFFLLFMVGERDGDKLEEHSLL